MKNFEGSHGADGALADDFNNLKPSPSALRWTDRAALLMAGAIFLLIFFTQIREPRKDADNSPDHTASNKQPVPAP